MAAPTSQRAFTKGLKEKAFERVYYVQGDDDFQKDEAVRQLIAAAVDPATRDFNLEQRRGGEVDQETLETLLGTPPMMAERRVAVVRDVGSLKRDARAVLDRYLERPAGDVVLVLVASAGAKRDRELEAKAFVVEFPVLGDERVPKWIVHYASTELKVKITPEAAGLLHAAVDSDLAALAAELDKLASYVRGNAGASDGASDAAIEIDEAAVSAIVGIRRGETLGDFLDAVADRKTGPALSLIPHILQQPKTTGVSVVMALSVQALAMAWGRARLDRGVSSGTREKEYIDLLKETGAFPMRPWGEAVQCWARAVPRWTAAQLDDALAVLLVADRTLKDTRLSNEEQVLSTLVLQLCTDGRERAA